MASLQEWAANTAQAKDAWTHGTCPASTCGGTLLLYQPWWGHFLQPAFALKPTDVNASPVCHRGRCRLGAEKAFFHHLKTGAPSPNTDTSSCIRGSAAHPGGYEGKSLVCWPEKSASQQKWMRLREHPGASRTLPRLSNGLRTSERRTNNLRHDALRRLSHGRRQKATATGPRALLPTVRLERRTLWTMNAVPGTSYGESPRRFSGQEHRRWDPTRSKLGAECFAPRPIQSDFSSWRDRVVPRRRSRDIGEPSSRSSLWRAKSFRRTACLRGPRPAPSARVDAHGRSSTGFGPRARRCSPACCVGVLLPTKVPWLFQDVAQAGQVDMFINACQRFLAPGGMGLLSPKRRANAGRGKGSCTVSKRGRRLVSSGYILDEVIELTGYEDNHRLFVVHHPGA